MRVLVTGANGLVGAHLIQSPNIHFYAATRQAASNTNTGAEWLRADLAADFDTIGWPNNLDAIVYLAQSRRYQDLPNGAADMIAVNVAGLIRLMTYAAKLDKPPQIIMASTGDVYGRSSGAPFKETDELFQNVAQPPALYPLSRKLAEDYASSFAVQFGLKLTIIRLFHIYGSGMPDHALIARLIANIRAGNPINLAGTDGLIIHPTEVQTVVAAILSLIEQNPSERGQIEVYNVANPQRYSLREICETIGQFLGIAPHFDYQAASPAPYISPDVSKFAAHYGELAAVSLQDGLTRLLNKSDG